MKRILLRDIARATDINMLHLLFSLAVEMYQESPTAQAKLTLNEIEIAAFMAAQKLEPVKCHSLS